MNTGTIVNESKGIDASSSHHPEKALTLDLGKKK
jgi:hypothetical protein